jgi:hypothetical protein
MAAISALLAYPEPSNRLFKQKKPIQEVSAGFWHQNVPHKSLNNDCSAQNNPREPKLVTLKPPGNEDLNM